LKEVLASNKEGQKGGTLSSFTLKNIENALRFIEFVAKYTPFEKTKKEAKELWDIQRNSLMKLKEHMISVLISFPRLILDADKDVGVKPE
jgi:hypothetical protein